MHWVLETLAVVAKLVEKVVRRVNRFLECVVPIIVFFHFMVE